MLSLKKHIEITSVRYISLPKDTLRRIFLSFTLRCIKYKKTWVPGVDVMKNPGLIEACKKKGFSDTLRSPEHAFRRLGVAGCWLAHTGVIKSITEREGYTVVLEDDFICHPHFFERANEMIGNFSYDFDVALFDTGGEGPVAADKVADRIYKTNNISHPIYRGAHCLFINNKNIDKILLAINESPIHDYDGFLLHCGALRNFIFFTDLCSVVNFGSHTSNCENNIYGIFDWFRKKRKLANVLKR